MAEASDSRKGMPPLTVSLLYRPSEAQRALFPPDRKAMYDEAAALRILHSHIDAEGGISERPEGGGRGGGEGGGAAGTGAERCKGNASILLDPRLADALFSSQTGAAH